jgi:chromatin remodeling complex protein RSC6
MISSGLYGVNMDDVKNQQFQKYKVVIEIVTDGEIDDNELNESLTKGFSNVLSNMESFKYSCKMIEENHDESDNEFVPVSAPTCLLSLELCEFLGEPNGTRLARIQVVERIRDYVKDNQCEDQNDRRNFKLDYKLEKLFGDSEFRMTINQERVEKSNRLNRTTNKATDIVHYFNTIAHLERHFL